MGEISKLYIYKLYILLFELYDNTVIKLLLICDLMGEISKLYIYKLYILLFELYDNTVITLFPLVTM